MTQDVWCVLATRGFHRRGFLEMAGFLNAVNYPTKPDWATLIKSLRSQISWLTPAYILPLVHMHHIPFSQQL